MSFYGSLYYQAGEAFAKIFLDNIGTRTKSTDFKNVTEDSEILAKSRKGDLTLRGGNKWISLEGESGNSVCTIRHSGPDTSQENLKTYIMPIQVAEAPPKNIPVNIMPLTDDIYFTAPAIYYDEAGHIIPTGNLTYFKIPKIAIQASIDEIADGLTDLNTVVEEQQTLLTETANGTENARTRVEGLENLIGDQSHLNSPVSITQTLGNYGDMVMTISATGQDNLGHAGGIAEYLSQAYQLIDKLDSTTGTLAISNTNINNTLLTLSNQLADIESRLRTLEKANS